MPTYQIEFVKSALKELDVLDRTTRKRVLSNIAKLSTEPRPSGCKKLAGDDDRYRIGSAAIESCTWSKMRGCSCSC